MDSTTRALLLSWDWRFDVIPLLLLAAALYLRGWLRLRKTSDHPSRHRSALTNGWRLTAYLAGLAIIAVALLSPIDILGGMLFSFHMVQHLLLVMLAPPLLLLANPLPFLTWGLPRNGRQAVGRALNQKSAFRRLLRAITSPGLVWMLFIAVFLGWHDPNAYNAALQYDRVHDLEHFTFFLTAMLYWQHVTGAAPRIYKRFNPGATLAYLIGVVPVMMLTGAAITFASEPIYTYYTNVPRLWGLTAVQDQMIGGVIMWVPGSMMFLIAALIVIARLAQAEENKPLPSKPIWTADAVQLASGLESY